MKKLALMAVLAVAGCAQQDRDANQVPWEKVLRKRPLLAQPCE